MARANKKSSKRDFNPMSLAFLDVMSCGFGAVVLIFLILDHSSSIDHNTSSSTLSAEINLLEEEILEGEAGLVRIRNTLSDTDFEVVAAQGLARSIQEEIETFLDELAQLENTTLADTESIERLKADIASLEEEARRLRAAEDQFTGNNARQYVGDGNRQYLTGLILGGNRILILVDMSASMLDNTIINILRRRNMSDEARINSEKWLSVRATVDWLTTQLPIPSQYQIYMFNNEVSPLLPGTENQWLEVADDNQLNQAVENLNNIVPNEGTNLENLFLSIQNLSPQPDNIYLLTDGLPTLSNRSSKASTISGRDREVLFTKALEALPSGIPVNVILSPLEGDPMAASAYWRLAVSTGGSFLNPSKDWP